MLINKGKKRWPLQRKEVIQVGDEVWGLAVKFILIPVMYLIGIVVVGGILQDAMHLPNAVTVLFEAAGGVTGLALYFRSNLRGL